MVYICWSQVLLSLKTKDWSSTSSDSTFGSEQLLQWHQQLGHPSFGLMQRLFSSLFRQCSNHNFACDACELAKHRRFSCPSSLNKSSAPFMIVHSDVWGPSRVVSVSGYCWLWLLLIASLEWHGFIYCTIKVMCSLVSRCFIKWLLIV